MVITRTDALEPQVPKCHLIRSCRAPDAQGVDIYVENGFGPYQIINTAVVINLMQPMYLGENHTITSTVHCGRHQGYLNMTIFVTSMAD